MLFLFSQIVEDEDWIIMTGEKEILAICNKVISENEKAVINMSI
jgi:Asp-tRNA(Asn)/Glu-tRNA(Gln) amidotransferase B subunit